MIPALNSDLPTVSVIVPVYADAAGARRCLGALRAQDYPRELTELLVVDNGSPPADVEALHQACTEAGARLIQEQRPGSYAARNCGIDAARGQILAFTDADCLPRPSWLSAGVACLQRAPSIAAVGGEINIFPAVRGRPNLIEQYDGSTLRQADFVERLHFAATANLLVRRTTFDAAGPFDASLKSHGDFEWGQRVHHLGLTLGYCAEAAVDHPARGTFASTVKKARRLAGGAVDLRRRRGQSLLEALHEDWGLFRWHLRGAKHLSGARGARLWLLCGVVVTVQWIRTLEILRLSLGGTSERG